MVKTVRFSDMRNYGSPITAVRTYDAQKVDEIILLDIRASAEYREPNYQMIEDIAGSCFCPVAYGGGISKFKDIEKILKAGADKVIINTATLENPTMVKHASKIFGSQCITLSLDIKDSELNRVFYESGRMPLVMTLPTLIDFYQGLEAGEIFINNISRDGTLKGYDIRLLKNLVNRFDIPIIAAGGAKDPQDFVDAVNIAKVSAVAAGSMFLFTEYSPMASRKYMYDKGINVRPYEKSDYK